MKTRTTIILATLTLLAVSCGTSAKRHLSDGSAVRQEVTIKDTELQIWLDDHTRSRKNADKVFQSWAESRNMQRHITGKRLMSIAPKEDGCRLTYDFRMIDGSEQRIILNVPNYKQGYRKKKNAKKNSTLNTAVVNGRTYTF